MKISFHAANPRAISRSQSFLRWVTVGCLALLVVVVLVGAETQFGHPPHSCRMRIRCRAIDVRPKAGTAMELRAPYVLFDRLRLSYVDSVTVVTTTERRTLQATAGVANVAELAVSCVAQIRPPPGVNLKWLSISGKCVGTLQLMDRGTMNGRVKRSAGERATRDTLLLETGMTQYIIAVISPVRFCDGRRAGCIASAKDTLWFDYQDPTEPVFLLVYGAPDSGWQQARVTCADGLVVAFSPTTRPDIPAVNGRATWFRTNADTSAIEIDSPLRPDPFVSNLRKDICGAVHASFIAFDDTTGYSVLSYGTATSLNVCSAPLADSLPKLQGGRELVPSRLEAHRDFLVALVGILVCSVAALRFAFDVLKG